MKVKVAGLALLLLSSVAMAEQKLLCEYNGNTDVIYLMGDGEDMTWPWNDHITIRESWSDDTVLWSKRLEMEWTWQESLYSINRYTGDFWMKYTSKSDEDGFSAKGSCRPATEKLF